MSDKEEEIKADQQPTEEPQKDQTESDENQTSDTAINEGETRQFGQAENDEQIQLLEKELIEEKNKYLRLYAEFENFRRRTAKERLDLIGSATGDLMKEILPVVDDFERAIQSNEGVDDPKTLKEAFELLHSKMVRLLGNKGLKPIESAGDDFDPEIHEAVAQIPAEKKKDKGKILDVVEKGYKLNEKTIRHPKVVVGS